MAAKNINQKMYSQTQKVTTYDDGRPSTTEWNPQKISDHVETSSYVNNKALRPVSPYTMNKKRWYCSSGIRQGRHGSSIPKYSDMTYGITFFPYPPNPSVPGASRQVAINGALLSHKRGGVNLPLLIAEGNQTLSMISSRLKSIGRIASFVRMKAGQLAKHKRELEAQNLWLEYRWGWLPLMSDIKDIMSTIAGNLAYTRITARGSSKNAVKGVFQQNNYTCDYKTYYTGNGHPGVTFNYAKKDEYRCVIRSELNSAPAAKAAALGFNPLALAWELIPYSCVADYLVNVGDFLNALDATNGYSFKDGCVTHFQTWEFDFNVDSYWSEYNNANWVSETGKGTYREIIMSREVLTSYPTPKVTFSSPFSTVHCLNALALLTQTFRKKF
jgi:hypothetical protein